MKFPQKLRLAIKHMKVQLVIYRRITSCKNVDGRNYADCINCKYVQRHYRKYLERIKWTL